MKINFGCGDNRLDGWTNHDQEVDISAPLPYTDASTDFILCEHCVEHIPQYLAIEFFRECRRILRDGGVARIIVPSIEKIKMSGDTEYFKFTERWQSIGPTRRGAMHAITYAHGHQAIWTGSVLSSALFLVGFSEITPCEPRKSGHMELIGIDGHHKAIGERFNDIESCIYEATK